MHLNPPSQYADDRNLRARQRLWQCQQPFFDIAAWVLDLAGILPGQRVLDVGCGNGGYLARLRERGARAVGLDLSLGMLRSASHPELVNADVTALPFRDGWADVIVAPHMLYHVPDRPAAARELRRVLAPGGLLVAVTNGEGHLRELRDVAQQVAGQPGWRMRSLATESFRLENGADQLAVAFGSVQIVLPRDTAPVRITDPAVAADYVASMGDIYAAQIARPWPEVVAGVHAAVARIIAERGSFAVHGQSGAFVCR